MCRFNKIRGINFPLFFYIKGANMGKKKKEECEDIERCWWVKRYIRMSNAEIRRANSGGSRAYNKRKKKESEPWEV